MVYLFSTRVEFPLVYGPEKEYYAGENIWTNNSLQQNDDLSDTLQTHKSDTGGSYEEGIFLLAITIRLATFQSTMPNAFNIINYYCTLNINMHKFTGP